MPVFALLSSLGCVLPPAGLDAGLDDETSASTSMDATSGDGDGDPTTGDGDPTTGDGDPTTTGDGDGDPGPPEPFECLSASDLDGDPAQLPMGECSVSCDELFAGGQQLQLRWSLDGDGDGATSLGIMRSPSGLYTVDWRANQPARIRRFDEGGAPTDLIDLDVSGELLDAAGDEQGMLYVAYEELWGNDTVTWVAAFDPEDGARLWEANYLEPEAGVLLAGAPDGFAMIFEDSNSIGLARFMHDGDEPLWSDYTQLLDGTAVSVGADGTTAVAGRPEVVFYDEDGVFIDWADNFVDRVAVHDLEYVGPGTFAEVAEGYEEGEDAPGETVDALLTIESVDGSFITRPYRWGDLDCADKLVPGDDRLRAIARLRNSTDLVAAGEQAYEFTPGVVTTMPWIMQVGTDGVVQGSDRIALPSARATAVYTDERSFYVVVEDLTGNDFDYQIRKYWRAEP